MANWTIEKNFIVGAVTVGSESITVNTLGGVKGDKGDVGDQGIQGIQGVKGDAPTTEELNVLIDAAIVPYVTAMDEAIDIINGQII